MDITKIMNWMALGFSSIFLLWLLVATILVATGNIKITITNMKQPDNKQA